MNLIAFSCSNYIDNTVFRYLSNNEIDYYKNGEHIFVLSERSLEDFERTLKGFLKLVNVEGKEVFNFILLATNYSRITFSKSKNCEPTTVEQAASFMKKSMIGL